MRSQRIALGPVANQCNCHVPPVAVEFCYCVNQNIDAFDGPELTHEDKVGCIGPCINWRKLLFRHAVVDDAHETLRLADLAAEYFGAVSALKKEEVAAQHQQLFSGEIEFAGERVVSEQKTATVRRIGADRTRGIECQARIGAAFCAVAVHHVRACSGNSPHDVAEYGRVARAEVPAHRNPRQAQRKRGLKFPECLRGTGATGIAVCNQPDAMAASDLFAGEIQDVAIKASHRRPEHVQNIQRGNRREWSDSQKGDKPPFLIARIPSDVLMRPSRD